MLFSTIYYFYSLFVDWSTWPFIRRCAQWAYRPLPPLDAGLIPGLKYRGNDYLGVAPNPGGQFQVTSGSDATTL